MFKIQQNNFDEMQPSEIQTEPELSMAAMEMVSEVLSLSCDSENSLSGMNSTEFWILIFFVRKYFLIFLGMENVSITDIAEPSNLHQEDVELKMIIKAMQEIVLTACKNEGILGLWSSTRNIAVLSSWKKGSNYLKDN